MQDCTASSTRCTNTSEEGGGERNDVRVVAEITRVAHNHHVLVTVPLASAARLALRALPLRATSGHIHRLHSFHAASVIPHAASDAVQERVPATGAVTRSARHLHPQSLRLGSPCFRDDIFVVGAQTPVPGCVHGCMNRKRERKREREREYVSGMFVESLFDAKHFYKGDILSPIYARNAVLFKYTHIL